MTAPRVSPRPLLRWRVEYLDAETEEVQRVGWTRAYTEAAALAWAALHARSYRLWRVECLGLGSR